MFNVLNSPRLGDAELDFGNLAHWKERQLDEQNEY